MKYNTYGKNKNCLTTLMIVAMKPSIDKIRKNKSYFILHQPKYAIFISPGDLFRLQPVENRYLQLKILSRCKSISPRNLQTELRKQKVLTELSEFVSL